MLASYDLTSVLAGHVRGFRVLNSEIEIAPVFQRLPGDTGARQHLLLGAGAAPHDSPETNRDLSTDGVEIRSSRRMAVAHAR